MRAGHSSGKVLVRVLIAGVLVLLAAAGIARIARSALQPTSFPPETQSYTQARMTFRTHLLRTGPSPQESAPLPAPPPGAKEVRVQSGALALKAWVSPPPTGGGKLPAVLFLHGGFAFGPDDWEQAQPFRDAGFVVMTPALRGENGQPGSYTMFYDEVDDVLAAAETLAALPYVDASRIFVAGHSAGGTLALLAAMASDRFKAAASFSGSPDQVTFIEGQESLAPFDRSDPREFQMRSPLAFPRSFKCPVRMYYGDQERFFDASTRRLAELVAAAGVDAEAISVPGDHFSSVEEEIQQSVGFFKQR